MEDEKPYIIKKTIFEEMRRIAANLKPGNRNIALCFDVYKVEEVLKLDPIPPDDAPPEWLLLVEARLLACKKNQFLGNVMYFHNSDRSIVAATIKAYIDDLMRIKFKVVATVSSGKREMARVLQELKPRKAVDGRMEFCVGNLGYITHMYDPSWLLRELGQEFRKHDILYEVGGRHKIASYRDMKHLLNTISDDMTSTVRKMFSKEVGELVENIQTRNGGDETMGTADFCFFFNKIQSSLKPPSGNVYTPWYRTFWQHAVKILSSMHLVEDDSSDEMELNPPDEKPLNKGKAKVVVEKQQEPKSNGGKSRRRRRKQKKANQTQVDVSNGDNPQASGYNEQILAAAQLSGNYYPATCDSEKFDEPVENCSVNVGVKKSEEYDIAQKTNLKSVVLKAKYENLFGDSESEPQNNEVNHAGSDIPQHRNSFWAKGQSATGYPKKEKNLKLSKRDNDLTSIDAGIKPSVVLIECAKKKPIDGAKQTLKDGFRKESEYCPKTKINIGECEKHIDCPQQVLTSLKGKPIGGKETGEVELVKVSYYKVEKIEESTKSKCKIKISKIVDNKNKTTIGKMESNGGNKVKMVETSSVKIESGTNMDKNSIKSEGPMQTEISAPDTISEIIKNNLAGVRETTNDNTILEQTKPTKCTDNPEEIKKMINFNREKVPNLDNAFPQYAQSVTNGEDNPHQIEHTCNSSAERDPTSFRDIAFKPENPDHIPLTLTEQYTPRQKYRYYKQKSSVKDDNRSILVRNSLLLDRPEEINEHDKMLNQPQGLHIENQSLCPSKIVSVSKTPNVASDKNLTVLTEIKEKQLLNCKDLTLQEIKHIVVKSMQMKVEGQSTESNLAEVKKVPNDEEGTLTLTQNNNDEKCLQGAIKKKSCRIVKVEKPRKETDLSPPLEMKHLGLKGFSREVYLDKWHSDLSRLKTEKVETMNLLKAKENTKDTINGRESEPKESVANQLQELKTHNDGNKEVAVTLKLYKIKLLDVPAVADDENSVDVERMGVADNHCIKSTDKTTNDCKHKRMLEITEINVAQPSKYSVAEDSSTLNSSGNHDQQFSQKTDIATTKDAIEFLNIGGDVVNSQEISGNSLQNIRETELASKDDDVIKPELIANEVTSNQTTNDLDQSEATLLYETKLLQYIASTYVQESGQSKDPLVRCKYTLKMTEKVVDLMNVKMDFPQYEIVRNLLVYVQKELDKCNCESYLEQTALNIKSEAELDSLIDHSLHPILVTLEQCSFNRYIDTCTVNSIVSNLKNLVQPWRELLMMTQDLFTMWMVSLNSVRKIVDQWTAVSDNPVLRLENLTCDSINDFVYCVQKLNQVRAIKIVPSQDMEKLHMPTNFMALGTLGNFMVRIYYPNNSAKDKLDKKNIIKKDA